MVCFFCERFGFRFVGVFEGIYVLFDLGCDFVCDVGWW